MPRDAAQSCRLHESEFSINTIDPMTGSDIDDVTNHLHSTDGNLTIYFETESTRKAYSERLIDYPIPICLFRLQMMMAADNSAV